MFGGSILARALRPSPRLLITMIGRHDSSPKCFQRRPQSPGAGLTIRAMDFGASTLTQHWAFKGGPLRECPISRQKISAADLKQFATGHLRSERARMQH